VNGRAVEGAGQVIEIDTATEAPDGKALGVAGRQVESTNKLQTGNRLEPIGRSG
jgi:hypothetical protein